MKTIAFHDMKIKGELAVRSGLNFCRLEGEWYRPDQVFGADKHGWPGDWEGRVILALAMLTQSTHRTPAYLDEIVSLIPSHLNEKRYLGRVLPEGQFDEQQMAGHSWLIRGLIEYCRLYQDSGVKEILEGIVRNLLLPSKGFFCQYPIDQESRYLQQDIWHLSKLQTKTRQHAATSDAGCAFIMIDGATAAYEFLGWHQLKELIEEMIGRYLEMDFVGLHIQTHATLSGLRGILRFHEITGDPKYLDKAIEIFKLYRDEAWSEVYGNYNWFGLPRWTEPCAIIDSFMISVTLWRLTGEAEYLEFAHLIYFNAISHGNRYTGAFGTDRVTGAKDSDDNLLLFPLTFEVYWCCTMRGGEGLSRAIEYSFFTEGNSVFIPFYQNCMATVRPDNVYIKLEETTKYPYEGNISFRLLDVSLQSKVKLNFFAPVWSAKEKIVVSVNGVPVASEYAKGFIAIDATLHTGDVIELDLGLSLRVEATSFKNSVHGFHKFLYGPMLLGHEINSVKKEETEAMKGNDIDAQTAARFETSTEISLPADSVFERINRSKFRLKDSDVILSPLCDVKYMTREDSVRQILFKG